MPVLLQWSTIITALTASNGSYAIAEAEQAADVVLELRIEGTKDPPSFWKYFPACLGYDKPPARHSWSTDLPEEALLLLLLSLFTRSWWQANGLIDVSEYRFFVSQLNTIGQAVDQVNSEATWLRVQAGCFSVSTGPAPF